MPVTKLSILSLVLLAASAVTAFVLPGKSNDLKQSINSADDGTMISDSGRTPGAGCIKSCIPDASGDVVFSCHVTTETLTGADSEAEGVKTAGNTSLSHPNNGIDTTSIGDDLSQFKIIK